MLSWPPTVRIFLAAESTDMRKGFDSLAYLVESSMALDPVSGHLFVFRSRRGDRIKILWWDRDGYCLWYKPLEKGSFRFPAATKQRVEGRGGQGGGPDDDPRRDRPGQRPEAATLRAATCMRFSGGGPFRMHMGPYNSGMCEPASPLPDDLDLCHEIIRQQAETIRESQRRIEQLEHQVELLLRRQFGPRRESVDPDQLRLFSEDALDGVAEDTGEKSPEPEDVKPKRKWRRRGRQKLPEGLPRKRVEYELSAEELPCPDCGQSRTKIGEELSEQLEYVPSSLFIIVHARFRYACRPCQEHVALADKPPQPIDKGLPGPGLLAQTITSKYSDHLPLYRLEDIFARHGVELSRSTLCGWMASCAESAHAALRPDGQAGLALDRHPHRRHHRAGAGPDAAQDPHRSVLGLHRGCPQSLRGLRLHATPDAGRPGAVPERISGVISRPTRSPATTGSVPAPA